MIVVLDEFSVKHSRLMKRIGGLYEKIVSIDNLKLADKMARRGKGDSY